MPNPLTLQTKTPKHMTVHKARSCQYKNIEFQYNNSFYKMYTHNNVTIQKGPTKQYMIQPIKTPKTDIEEMEACVIDLSDFESDMFEYSSEDQFEMIADSYSIEQDTREQMLLPKINVKNNYISKQPSIADIYCRKKQLKLFKERENRAEIVWQTHVVISICEDDWVLKRLLAIMFYTALYQQRIAEIKIVNLQFSKGMVGFKQDQQKLYETGVIVYNIVDQLSVGKLKLDKLLLIAKTDSMDTMTKKMDKLLFTLQQLLHKIKPMEDLKLIENLAKRLSLIIMNINKIVVQLYDDSYKCQVMLE